MIALGAMALASSAGAERRAEAALEEHRGMILAIAREGALYVRGVLELQDMESIAMVAAWKAARRYDATRGMTMGSWIATKVRWALHDEGRAVWHSRARDRRPHHVDIDFHARFLAAKDAGPEAAVDEQDLVEWMRRQLTPAEFEAIYDVVVLGFSQVELARRHGVSGGRIGQRQVSAREKLRRAMRRAERFGR